MGDVFFHGRSRTASLRPPSSHWTRSPPTSLALSLSLFHFSSLSLFLSLSLYPRPRSSRHHPIAAVCCTASARWNPALARSSAGKSTARSQKTCRSAFSSFFFVDLARNSFTASGEWIRLWSGVGKGDGLRERDRLWESSVDPRIHGFLETQPPSSAAAETGSRASSLSNNNNNNGPAMFGYFFLSSAALRAPLRPRGRETEHRPKRKYRRDSSTYR